MAASSSPAKQAGQSLGFPNIRYNGKTNLGTFRMASELYGWKSNVDAGGTGANKHIYKSSGILAIEWQQVTTREALLFIRTTADGLQRFSGLKEDDYKKIFIFCRNNWSQDIARLKGATRGWNWGEYGFDEGDKTFNLDINQETAMRIPIDLIKKVDKQDKAKTDLTIGFESDEDAPTGGIQVVTEITFHVPPAEEGDDPLANLTSLHDTLLAKGNISTASSSVILLVPYLNFASPPGRFDVQLVQEGVKLAGRAAYFRVLWESVNDIYYLPSAPTSFLFLELDEPLKKGIASEYHNVVLQIDSTMVGTDYQLNLSNGQPERKLNIKEGPLAGEFALQPNMRESGSTLCKLMSLYGGFTPLFPTSSVFESSSGKSDVLCFYKTANGRMFLMKSAILFVPKPSLIFHHRDIQNVDFRRLGGGSGRTRTFAFTVVMRKNQQEHEFSSVDRSEREPIITYFKRHNVAVLLGDIADEEDVEGPEMGGGMGMDSDSDDSEFNEDAESGSDADDEEDEEEATPEEE